MAPDDSPEFTKELAMARLHGQESHPQGLPALRLPPGYASAATLLGQALIRIPPVNFAPGWQRQAESSELGDGEFPVRTTIAKALGP
jgi:hypothetical protein